MNLSIIILSYNTKTLLQRCLNSVLLSMKSSRLKAEIIVIDNNSSDGSAELLKTHYPQVKTVFNKDNIGYGKANNLGIEMAKGEYILLLNSDCVVIDDALETLLRFAQKNPRAFVGGKLFNEDQSAQQSCGPFYTLPVVLLMLFFKGDQLKLTRYSPDEIKEVDWVSGACILVRKKDIQDIGGFDEEIFMYMEEIDLLYRAKQKNYRVWFYPGAHFTHTGAASSGHKKEPVVNIYRGLSYFYKKHRSIPEQRILNILLTLKAWLVRGICGIMGDRDLSNLYAKALAVLK